jgi:hypothetical protein
MQVIEDVNRRERGTIMTNNEILAALVALGSALLLFSFWKQILLILLFGVIVVFCLGIYSVTAAVH